MMTLVHGPLLLAVYQASHIGNLLIPSLPVVFSLSAIFCPSLHRILCKANQVDPKVIGAPLIATDLLIML